LEGVGIEIEMPNDRFFHKGAGHSEKVNSLSDFEELIWRYYVLSADDFGLMKLGPDLIRAEHERAASRPVKAVQRALDRIVAVELVHRYEHQGRAYIYSRNWQEYQKVDYPREASCPCPPEDQIAACKPATQGLLGWYPGGKAGRDIRRLVADGLSIESARVRIGFDSSDEYLRFTRRAKAKAQAEAEDPGSGMNIDTTRVQRFVDLYRELHQEYIGVAYLGNPQKDYQAACELVGAFDDGMLKAIAIFGLNDTDPFMAKDTRTITKLKSRASGYAQELRTKKLA
jgi:hypothetical protein